MKNINTSQKNIDDVNKSFIILGAGTPHEGTIHSALRNTSGKLRVIDWLLQVSSVISPDFFFVGGYQFDEVVKQYPHIKYIYNPEWGITGPAFSMLKIPFNFNTEYYISYADILFHTPIIREMESTMADIVVVVDSSWHQRYIGRSEEDIFRCEKVVFQQDSIRQLGTDIDPKVANGEFIGLVKFSPKVIKYLKDNIQILNESYRLANLSQFVDILRQKNFEVKAVDIKGDWAELKESSDLVQFVMGTKAQTLERLQNLVKKSQIENQISFTVKDWGINSLRILNRIKGFFAQQNVIVRSSSLSEDSFTSSNAGAFKSVLDVNCNNPKELHSAVEEVIASYSDKNNLNQVLVQPMVENLRVSGVILTKTLVHSAPYYVINYDETSPNSDSITNGSSQCHKTLIVLRDTPIHEKSMPASISKLIPAVQEIEQLLNYDSLDIEFGIGSTGLIHIFQVRPITFKGDVNQLNSTDLEVYETINLSSSHFNDLQRKPPFILGDKSFFGIMPDWNPAEIIGTKPGMLAISLYRYLITDEVWAAQRAEYGYRDVRPNPLMVTFGGHPYIDIRASFNSFIPANLSNDLSERLVNFYLDWLELNPHLHDKVEFDVVPTCYALDFPKWERRLKGTNRFSNEEIRELKEALKNITLSAFLRNSADLNSIAILERKYNDILKSDLNPLDRAIILLDDCRRYGTLAFSHLARSAFIGMTLLKSAVDENIISKEAMNSFLNSINTVTHKLTDDALLVLSGMISWETFVENYGHLRPGTYDINSLSYFENAEYFLRPIVELASEVKKEKNSNHWNEEKKAFSLALKNAGISLELDEVELFIREAIEGREYAKFVFSRNLSEALNCFIEYGEKFNISRNELANIPLDVFIGLRTGSIFGSNIANLLKDYSQRGRTAINLANRIELPPLLFKTSDFYLFLYPENQPNYIGVGNVIAKIAVISDINSIEYHDLAGCIVLIGQADPGYDWLFGQNIVGLITKWGGANSHMAIRCAEFGLPAAIGVGELEFQRILKSTIIELDPGNHRIQIIR